MMLLYVCRECGYWQDVSLTQAFQHALEPLAKWSAQVQGATYQEPAQIYACPSGHGLMKQVQLQDRLFVREAMIEENRLPIP